MSNIITTQVRKYKYARFSEYYAPVWHVFNNGADAPVQNLNLPLEQDSWQKCTADTIKGLLLAEGQYVDGTPAIGHWELDGNMIANPSEELGEEFGEVCQWVETTPATPAQFVKTFTEAEVDDLMSAAVTAFEQVEKHKAASGLSEYNQKQLGEMCLQFGIIPANTMPLTVIVSGKRLALKSEEKVIVEHVRAEALEPGAFYRVFATQKEAAQAIAYHIGAILRAAKNGDQATEIK